MKVQGSVFISPARIDKEALHNYLINFKWETRFLHQTMTDDIKKIYHHGENDLQSAYLNVSWLLFFSKTWFFIIFAFNQFQSRKFIQFRASFAQSMGINVNKCSQMQKDLESENDTYFRRNMNKCVISYKDTIINSKEEVIEYIESCIKRFEDYERQKKRKCKNWFSKLWCPVEYPYIDNKILKQKEQYFHHTFVEKRFGLLDCEKAALKDTQAKISAFTQTIFKCVDSKIMWMLTNFYYKKFWMTFVHWQKIPWQIWPFSNFKFQQSTNLYFFEIHCKKKITAKFGRFCQIWWFLPHFENLDHITCQVWRRAFVLLAKISLWYRTQEKIFMKIRWQNLKI